VVAVLAAGVSVLMIMGQIDLSIGAAVYLVGVFVAQLDINSDLPIYVLVIAGIAAGCVLGAWQGFWVVKLAVPSFVVTLAGLLMFRGVGWLWTNAETVAPVSEDFIGLSESFTPTGLSVIALTVIYVVSLVAMVVSAQGDRKYGLPVDTVKLIGRIAGLTVPFVFLVWISSGFLGVPAAVVWAAAIGLVLTVVMQKTRFGRNSYLIGSNREAARFSGIPVRKLTFYSFVLMGAIYGVGAVLLTARLGSAPANMGINLELTAIAAAVIGGTSLSGGKGTVIGAIAGALLLSTIDNGMGLMNVSSFAQTVVKGAVLLLALAVDAFVNRRSLTRI
jgi:D-xylose transport system permease protein